MDTLHHIHATKQTVSTHQSPHKFGRKSIDTQSCQIDIHSFTVFNLNQKLWHQLPTISDIEAAISKNKSRRGWKRSLTAAAAGGGGRRRAAAIGKRGMAFSDRSRKSEGGIVFPEE